jgi:hypothetical protein
MSVAAGLENSVAGKGARASPGDDFSTLRIR